MTTTTDPTFRTATEADVPALVALVESAYRGEASRAGWTTEADLLDGTRTDAGLVRAILADPGSRLLAAELGGELAACCHVARDAGDRAGETAASFGLFAVRPALQRAGLGRRVLAEAERVARAEWGAREMRMRVLAPRADLIAWYERRGYARTGRFSPFPYGDQRFGVPRRPDLVFETLVKPLT
ncbi:GNAT family N-acetyltransferase [Streptomyces sp. URMC 129]|uniref:GNAT family N-acetyltransferase n=1 Tax=Streptomyces sp. URMC 129 TaxID=3423407 RepID=UPI003F19F3E5